jgi:hypothetical protein
MQRPRKRGKIVCFHYEKKSRRGQIAEAEQGKPVDKNVRVTTKVKKKKAKKVDKNAVRSIFL